MSIDNVLFHVGPGFEVFCDDIMGDDTTVAKIPMKTFKFGQTEVTFEVEVSFYDDGHSHIFVYIHVGDTYVYEGVDECFKGWATPQEIRDFVKKVTDKFKSEVMEMDFSF
jgi:hypothetical protein